MSHVSFDHQLDMLESQLKELGAILVDGSPDQLHMASTRIQQLAVDLIQMADAVGRAELSAPVFSRRIRALSNGLTTVRENFLRQSAYVDHALALLVPETSQMATYPGARAYGGPVRQSGAFSVLSA